MRASHQRRRWRISFPIYWRRRWTRRPARAGNGSFAVPVAPRFKRMLPAVRRRKKVSPSRPQVDPNDDAKTRCALLFVDSVLRWLPGRDDDDAPFENQDVDAVACRVGDWAPRFLDRLFACADVRTESARVANHGAGDARSRMMAAGAARADAAGAELTRCVAARVFAALRPKARARARARVLEWAKHAPPSAAKDAAGLIGAACADDAACFEASTRDLVKTVLTDAADGLGASGGAAARTAKALRVAGGAIRSLAPASIASRVDAIDALLENGLAHDDKAVRRCARKLLRDALRGLLELRTRHAAPARDWPATGLEDDLEAPRVTWLGPPADASERAAVEAAAARLLETRVFSRRGTEPPSRFVAEPNRLLGSSRAAS